MLAVITGCSSSLHEHSSVAQDITTGSIAAPAAKPSETVAIGLRDKERFNAVEQKGTGVFTAQAQQSERIPAGVSEGPDGITINLAYVPIADAAKSVLSDILKYDYTISEKVTGSVTIQTSNPMSKSALLDTFDQALRINGAALIQSGANRFKIIPSSEISQTSAPLAGAGGRVAAGLQLKVVTLKNISASEMRRVLDPATPPGTVVKADDSRNLLLLAGSNKELADAASLISVFDVDWMKGMSIGVYPLSSSDPDAIVRELEPLLGLDKDGPLKGTLRLVPNKRLNSVMVISSRPQLIDRVRQRIQRLDKVAAETEEQLFVHKVRDRSASELAAILQRVLASNSATAAAGAVAPRFDQTTVATPEPDPSIGGNSINAGLPQRSVTTGPVAGSSAGGAASSSGSSGFTTGGTGLGSASLSTGTANGSAQTGGVPGSPATGDVDVNRTSVAIATRVPRIVADDQNHTLLITATRREYYKIEKWLNQIDRPPQQVMLEAMIAEVTLTDELKSGVKWRIGGTNNRGSFNSVDSPALAPNFLGFSYFVANSAGVVQASLQALSQVTKVNVVSAPSLMVLDNRRAQLQIGDQVPIVTQQAQAIPTVTGGIGSLPVVSNSIQLKDTGVILIVTPRIQESGKVLLEIEQEVSKAIATVTSGIDSPTITQRRVRTTVAVQDGDVVTIGGMIQDQNTLKKTQVPLLGNIPVIGTAFREKDDTGSRTELLIFIRPLIIHDEKDAQVVTEEFRRRMSFERPSLSQGRNIFDRDLRRILN